MQSIATRLVNGRRSIQQPRFLAKPVGQHHQQVGIRSRRCHRDRWHRAYRRGPGENQNEVLVGGRPVTIDITRDRLVVTGHRADPYRVKTGLDHRGQPHIAGADPHTQNEVAKKVTTQIPTTSGCGRWLVVLQDRPRRPVITTDFNQPSELKVSRTNGCGTNS